MTILIFWLSAAYLLAELLEKRVLDGRAEPAVAEVDAGDERVLVHDRLLDLQVAC